MLKNNKKGNFDLLQGAFISFVVIGVVAVVGLQVMGDVATGLPAGSFEANASADVLTGMAGLASKIPIIATVIGLVVLLAFILLIAQRRN